MGSIYESIEKNGVHPSVSHEAEELIHSGITSYELEFIMLNCGRLNFSVNIFSIHHQHIFPVHIGIGASRNVKKAAQATVINIFKLSMHAGDLNSKQRYDDGKMWDQMLSQGNTIINRNESEKEIELALEMSETQEEQKIRKIKNQKFSQFPPYKEQFKKDHIKWTNELKAAESILIENHYFAINDLNHFLEQYSDDKKYSSRRAKFCPRCITAFYKDTALEKHKDVCCGKKDYYRECLPNQLPKKYNTSRKWQSHHALDRSPITIYCDFESILKPGSELCADCHKNGVGRCRCLCGKDETSPVVSLHLPAIFVMVAVNSKNEIIKERIIACENDHEMTKHGGQKFVQALLEDEAFYKHLIRDDKTKPPTKRDVDTFLNLKTCTLCEEAFDFDLDFYGDSWRFDLEDRGLRPQRLIWSDIGNSLTEGQKIVFHHDHMSEQWKGPAHTTCNFVLDNSRRKKVNVFFHNLGRYDMSFVLPGLSLKGVRNPHAIPKNSQQLLMVAFNCYKVVDSLGHLSTGLGELMENLKKSGHDFPILRQSSLVKSIDAESKKEYLDEEKFEIAKQKGYFCYAFAESIAKCKGQKSIPEREVFKDLLGGESGITEKQHEFAKKSFDVFGCETLYCYMQLYCFIDVLCLSEVFSKYCVSMHSLFNLWPCHFLTLPSYCFEANLYLSKAELPYITNRSIYRTFEDMVRGGLAFTSQKIGTVREKEFEGDEEIQSLYTDANSLYSVPMTEKLPISNFEYLTQQQIDEFDLTGDSWNVNGDTGYVLVCNISYPKHLHKVHSDYPMFPERRMVNLSELSPYSQQLIKKLGCEKSALSTSKLVASLEDKEGYIVHWKHLLVGIKLGLKITKVEKIISFYQTAFAKPYIDICMKARSEAKTTFDRKLYKLAQVALFGKFLENIRRRKDCKFASSRKLLTAHTSKHSHTLTKIVDQRLCITFHKKNVLCLDKFPHIGASILDLAKSFMYDSYYNKIRPVLGNSVRVIFGDTDSLYLLYKTKKTKMEILSELAPIMDFSNFAENSPLYSPVNNSKTGYFKDESGGRVNFVQVISIKPKLYNILSVPVSEDTEETEGSSIPEELAESVTRMKGVPQKVAATVKHKQFEACVLEEEKVYKEYQAIRMKDYVLTTERISKLALSSLDTKRYWSCCQHSYAFGHAFIQKDICQFCFDEAAYENNVARENLRKIAKVPRKRKKKDHDFN